MIEVEQRSFITKKQYGNLIKELKDKGMKFEETNQITYYFKGDIDFRIQFTNTYTKLWLKAGNIHDDAREEVEVFIDNENRDNLLKLLKCLGYEIEIKWFRKRLLGNYQDITLTLDYTVGYGFIIELEKLIIDESKVEETKKIILNIFKDLGIEVSEKQEFRDKYDDYKINWDKYTKDTDEHKFLTE